MQVEILTDQHEPRRCRCRHAEFRNFPEQPPAGPLPPAAAFSHWRSETPRLRRRAVGGVNLIDVEHHGRTWTYVLSPAYTTVPAEHAAGLYQLPQGFDVGVLAD